MDLGPGGGLSGVLSDNWLLLEMSVLEDGGKGAGGMMAPADGWSQSGGDQW